VDVKLYKRAVYADGSVSWVYGGSTEDEIREQIETNNFHRLHLTRLRVDTSSRRVYVLVDGEDHEAIRRAVQKAKL
jgi:hypothetical protein